MLKILIKWLVNAVAIMIAAQILSGVSIARFWTALILVVVLGLINAVIRPILILLTLPINILTLGLFTLVINALLVLLASVMISGFVVTSFWQALLFSVLVSVFSYVLSMLTDRE
jgi:putative membrane protein